MAWAELLEQEWEEHFGHFAKDLEQMDSSGAPWGRVFFWLGFPWKFLPFPNGRVRKMGAPDDFIIISSSCTLGTGDIPWNSPTIF